MAHIFWIATDNICPQKRQIVKKAIHQQKNDKDEIYVGINYKY